jgi:hypothetical protein
VFFSEIGEFGGADEGEIGRVEDEDSPLLARFQVREGDFAELALFRIIDFNFEIGDFNANGNVTCVAHF